jgi:hypothetical protein
MEGMEKQLTAVEWLAKEIQEQLNMFFPNATLYQPTIEQAKQMEKEQIIDAYNNGDNRSAELYYNETFKSE